MGVLVELVAGSELFVIMDVLVTVMLAFEEAVVVLLCDTAGCVAEPSTDGDSSPTSVHGDKHAMETCKSSLVPSAVLQ